MRKCCKLSMDRVISAMKNKVHHRSAVVLFQWEKHSNQECKPVTFMRITNPHNSTTAVCSRTLKSRCSELQAIRRVVSGGQPSVLLQNEVLSLGDEQRRALLKEAGISDEIKIGPAEVLAIKVGLAIPWNKIRILRRWLKASNISLACEERMCHASRKAVGENLKGELAPFSFSLPSGGEEFRGAPLVFIPDMILKVVELLEENDRAGRLTWHNGVIPASEIWIKLGGDKGGGTFKMNFQIVNVAAPNSVNNTCVFCCFEADDSYTNLHIALERYKEQVEHLQGMTWSLDLELDFYHTEVDQSRYSLYSQELQRLHQYKVELQEAKQSESVLQQLATYMAVLIGESNPLTADLLHQSANTSKIVKQLETKIAASTAVVTREFPLNEGPFVKELDMALQSIGVHRQQYFGGTFVGNHVHKTLKFAKCHSIYDQSFIDEAQVHELEQSVQEFMEFFRTNFPKGTIPIKMHMVEDHAVQWARSTHVGFGLLGEQGAESIHAKFNNLARKFVRLGLGKKEVALSMYLSVNVKLEPSQLPEVLQSFLIQWAADPQCQQLLLNAWYLCDGALAGPGSAVLRALDLVTEGKPNGLILNMSKCELFNPNAGTIQQFNPCCIPTSTTSNLEILGAPIGSPEFCSDYIEAKRKQA
eukprot:Em0022g477a